MSIQEIHIIIHIDSMVCMLYNNWPISKSHNASDKYPIMYHFITKCAHIFSNVCSFSCALILSKCDGFVHRFILSLWFGMILFLSSVILERAHEATKNSWWNYNQSVHIICTVLNTKGMVSEITITWHLVMFCNMPFSNHLWYIPLHLTISCTNDSLLHGFMGK